MTKSTPAGWWVLLAFAVAIAGYGFANVVRGPAMYPPNLLDSFMARPWGIYPHAFLGSWALLLGPFQFRRDLLRNRPRHRLLGQAYLLACLGTGVAGLYMAFFSYGGMVTHLGFGGLALSLLGSILLAYQAIKGRDVARHREWMIRSYALIYAAVTLRIQIPTLMAVTRGDFDFSYHVTSWLCWVPNLLVAEWYVRRSRPRAADLPVVA